MSKPLPPITAADLKAQLDSGAQLRLIDVREPPEFSSELGHIDGAELVPLNTIPAHVQQLTGDKREIIAIGKSGMRSGHAAEFLAKSGLAVRNLHGGMLAWKAAGLPIKR